MPDIFTKRKRSDVMSRIRGTGNGATELRLIRIFRANRITGWRRGSKLPGKPDFAFSKLTAAIFVDGCFWHGCPKHATQPKNNATFWTAKLSGNKARDRRVNRELRANGWKVIRIWEHELTRNNERRLIARLRRHRLLRSDSREPLQRSISSVRSVGRSARLHSSPRKKNAAPRRRRRAVES